MRAHPPSVPPVEGDKDEGPAAGAQQGRDDWPHHHHHQAPHGQHPPKPQLASDPHHPAAGSSSVYRPPSGHPGLVCAGRGGEDYPFSSMAMGRTSPSARFLPRYQLLNARLNQALNPSSAASSFTTTAPRLPLPPFLDARPPPLPPPPPFSASAYDGGEWDIHALPHLSSTSLPPSLPPPLPSLPPSPPTLTDSERGEKVQLKRKEGGKISLDTRYTHIEERLGSLSSRNKHS